MDGLRLLGDDVEGQVFFDLYEPNPPCGQQLVLRQGVTFRHLRQAVEHTLRFVLITKNGKGDLAVMSIEAYEELMGRFEQCSSQPDRPFRFS